jgi:hypothetical protein
MSLPPPEPAPSRLTLPKVRGGRSRSRRSGARPEPESRPIARWAAFLRARATPSPPCQFAAARVSPTPRNQASKDGPQRQYLRRKRARPVPASQEWDLPRKPAQEHRQRQSQWARLAPAPGTSRAPQMPATARLDASFCRSPGSPLVWAGALSGSGCGPAAALLSIASPVAKAAHPGLWRRARGGALVARAKRGVRSKRRIAAAANRVLCSWRLYIVQSGQRRKTGHVKGGND